ncbi:MAG: arsenate reductase family protein [Christensenellales bacterium]
MLKYGIGKRELEARCGGCRSGCALRSGEQGIPRKRHRLHAKPRFNSGGADGKPQLLKLPIVRDGRRATVGYCPEIWEAWLKD